MLQIVETHLDLALRIRIGEDLHGLALEVSLQCDDIVRRRADVVDHFKELYPHRYQQQR